MTESPRFPDAFKKWAGAPRCCPYCGCIGVALEISDWSSHSDEDPENTATLTEYQCQGPCEGRSFWV